jgi:hypothetical protein
MTDCETFEVEIEMRGHGALDASRIPALEAHLAQCPSCRRYQALARRTEQTMTAHTLDVNGLEARILTLQAYRRTRSWFAVAVPAAMALLLILAVGHPVEIGVTLALTGGLLFGLFRLRVAAEARATARLARSQADYLAHYRRMLEGRIRRVHVLLGVIPLFACLSFLQATVWHLWPAGMRTLPVYAVLGAAFLLAFLRVLALRLHDVPAMRKELRDLDAA